MCRVLTCILRETIKAEGQQKDKVVPLTSGQFLPRKGMGLNVRG